jgi:hypothetical protein
VEVPTEASPDREVTLKVVSYDPLRRLGFLRMLSATMRQAHAAGERTFIDFSGSGLDVVNPLTGECQTAVLFIAVLGASNLTYAEPVLHQDLPTWIGCHVRVFEYFGGTTEIWVPDDGVHLRDLHPPPVPLAGPPTPTPTQAMRWLLRR